MKLQFNNVLIILINCLFIKQILCVSFETLYDRQLKSSYGFEILKHYHSENFGNETIKKFKGESVLFMTPWRQKGIDLAIRYMRKFDYFVPCYYDITQKKDPEQINLKINEHYSQQYLQRARQANPNIKILPRVFIHGMQGDVFYLASTDEIHMQTLVAHFKTVIQNKNYDGIVFSSPFITPNHKYPFSMKNFMKRIRQIIDSNGKKLFIVMEGVDNKPDNKISKKKARQIIDLSDKVIVTNYDYPKGNQGNVIPISPIDWIKQNYDYYCQIYGTQKLKPKLIMAIPLYGYFVALYGKYDPINGDEFLDKLKDQKAAWLYWHQQIQQCMIYLNKMQFLYFPCLHFYNSRLRYFEKLQVGVAAFQIGSGLQIFMQMF